MSSTATKTEILDDGLRYKSKITGSPFGISTNPGNATMSCFLCGKHRPRTLLKSRNLVGRNQAVCAPNCKDVEGKIAGTQ